MSFLTKPTEGLVEHSMLVKLTLCELHILLGHCLVFPDFGPLDLDVTQRIEPAFYIRPSFIREACIMRKSHAMQKNLGTGVYCTALLNDEVAGRDSGHDLGRDLDAIRCRFGAAEKCFGFRDIVSFDEGAV